mgnify:CR=1 FL=1
MLFNNLRIRKRLSLIIEKRFRKNWKNTEPNSNISTDNVAVVIVNYNTKELLTLLLFSIYKNLGIEQIAKIVIVDNNSNDGSVELLRTLDSKGIVHLISNKSQKYHGPALNQGIEYLNKNKNFFAKPFRYIWILDSDVIILKNNVIHEAVRFMKKTNASVIGQFQFNTSEEGDPHVSSILIDPVKVWNRQIHPFTENGMPTILFYKDIRKHELKIIDFPFRSENYIIHLGEGTLMQIFNNNNSENKQYKWASLHHKHHYGGNKFGESLLNEVYQLFIAETVELTDSNVINTLESTKDISIKFNEILLKNNS